jgi:hypothetical protein
LRADQPGQDHRPAREDPIVNIYEPCTPHFPLGIAAAAMAAITLSTLVVLPTTDSLAAGPHPAGATAVTAAGACRIPHR